MITRGLVRLLAERRVAAAPAVEPWQPEIAQLRTPAQAAPPQIAELGLDLGMLFHLLRRRWHLALAVALVLTTVAALLIVRLPNQYEAESLVVLNLRQPKIAELASSTGTLLSRSQTDISVVETEMQVMRSARLLRKLVLRLDLLNDPAFNPSESGFRLTTWVRSLLAHVNGRAWPLRAGRRCPTVDRDPRPA